VGAGPSGLRLLPLPARRKGEADTAARRESAIGVKGGGVKDEGFFPWVALRRSLICFCTRMDSFSILP